MNAISPSSSLVDARALTTTGATIELLALPGTDARGLLLIPASPVLASAFDPAAGAFLAWVSPVMLDNPNTTANPRVGLLIEPQTGGSR